MRIGCEVSYVAVVLLVVERRNNVHQVAVGEVEVVYGFVSQRRHQPAWY